jgi:hypothetical protein
MLIRPALTSTQEIHYIHYIHYIHKCARAARDKHYDEWIIKVLK